MDNVNVAPYCDVAAPLKSDCYLVLDIGGGTVDITAHRLDSSRNIEVLNVPTGNDWGGTKVNKEFSKFLQKLVNDVATTETGGFQFTQFIQKMVVGEAVTETDSYHFSQLILRLVEDKADTDVNDFPKFVSDCAPKLMPVRRAIMNHLLYNEFEDQKVTFGEEADETTEGEDAVIAVKLPPEFVSCYGNDFIDSQVKKLGDKRIEYEDEILFIHHSKVQEFFQPAVNGITDCAISSLEKLQSQIDTIYLVGGFGGCKYIYEKVAAQVKAKFGEKAFKLIAPLDHMLAVAQGAVLYRKTPDVICSRKVDATYGCAVCPPFEQGKHEEKYKYYDEDGIARCDNVLDIYMEMGEVARATEVVTSIVTPPVSAATVMHIAILSAFKTGVKYIIDSEGRPTVRKIGELILDIPNKDNLPRNERRVEITMDFSHTEIQAQAKYLVTGDAVKTTVDFLSIQ